MLSRFKAQRPKATVEPYGRWPQVIGRPVLIRDHAESPVTVPLGYFILKSMRPGLPYRSGRRATVTLVAQRWRTEPRSNDSAALISQEAVLSGFEG